MPDEQRLPMSSTNLINLRDLNPMTHQQAAELVSRLLKGFPYLNLARPKDYSTALIEVLVRYPLWVGNFALRRVRSDHDPQFLPSDLTVRKWCEEVVQPARDLRHWESKASTAPKALPPPSTRPLPPPKNDTTLEQRFHQALALEQHALRTPSRPTLPAQSGHMARVLADIEARKREREAANG